MNSKVRACFQSIGRSGVVFAVVFLFWLSDLIFGAAISLGKIVLFLFPYYILWLLVMITSVIRRGKSFRIIWMGSLRDDETFSIPNAPYAWTFLVGSVLILLAQIQFFLHE